MSHLEDRRKRLTQLALGAAAIMFVGIIVWIDIATPFWQEVVVLSGFVGAIISSLFTYFIVNRAVARQNAKRWAPMIRLGLTEFLHVLADDERSDTSRGIIVPRTVTEVDHLTAKSLHELQLAVVEERTQLATALSSWAEILSSSGENETLLLYIADLALHLQLIRDVSVESEKQVGTQLAHPSLLELNQEISRYNRKVQAAVAEIQERLEELPTTIVD